VRRNLTDGSELVPLRQRLNGVNLSKLLELRTVDGFTGCWIWQGRHNPAGYPVLHVDVEAGEEDFQPETTITISPNRLAARFYGIYLPHGRRARMRCGNRRCINPTHVGPECDTPAPKQARGERHGRARLTDEEVRAIRARVAAGAKQARLAEEYELTRSSISQIVSRKLWSHLD
jgi:hypothetical protein